MLRQPAAFLASRRCLCRWLGRLTRDETGVTAVEYGLMLAGVALFILVTVFAMGDELNNLFMAVQTKLNNSFS